MKSPKNTNQKKFEDFSLENPNSSTFDYSRIHDINSWCNFNQIYRNKEKAWVIFKEKIFFLALSKEKKHFTANIWISSYVAYCIVL